MGRYFSRDNVTDIGGYKHMYHNTTQVLGDNWRIIHDPDDRGREQAWQNGIPSEGARDCTVPGFAHQSFPYDYGIFWYERRFSLQLVPDDDHVILLRVGAADFLCETYVNGVRIGLHRGPEDPFSYDITSALNPGGENLLVFRVSKPYAEDVDGYVFGQIPHRNQRPDAILPGQCQNEVGISGRVDLSLQPKLRITDMYLHGNMATSSVDVRYTLHSDYEDVRTVMLDTRAEDKRTGEFCSGIGTAVTVGNGDTVIEAAVPLSDVRLWSPEDPYLYTVRASVQSENGAFLHTLTRRTGFREFKVGDDGYFYLNGKRIFLRCSHTGNSFPYSTHAIPHTPALVRRDLDMAKSSGLNMIRFISGACLEEQLDYADEIGLMIYEEPIASWLTQDGDHSYDLYREDLLSMVRRDRSHPSLCIWGLLNETPTTAPFGECCRWAREMLPDLRALDETRLVLFSSGRWDNDPTVGSVSNPYTDHWQCLWNREDEEGRYPVDTTPPDIAGFFRNVGDIHAYPIFPTKPADRDLLRTVGCDVRRPVFLSEAGTGSMFDVVWLTKYFTMHGVDRDLPDVRMIFRMYECLMRDLKEYGFETEFAFPQAMFAESYRLHARQRAFNFDIVRSNPYMNGYSITGLLDHSICGEGLWTMMREWKPGIVDAMQNGFAPLKWCLFLDTMHVYARTPVRFEAVLANEDCLEEREYPVCFRLFGDAGVIREWRTVLRPTRDQLKTFSVPVYAEEISLDVPTGTYTIHADIEGAAATDGVLTFHVTDPADLCLDDVTVAAYGLNETAEAVLSRAGVRVVPLDAADADQRSVVLIGTVAETARAAVFETVRTMTDAGCRVLFLDRRSFASADDEMHFCPVADKPHMEYSHDWLYHKEYLVRRGHPYFEGMPQGMMDMEYWLYLTNGRHLRGGEAPAEIASASFGTGMINADGYTGGINLALYQVGAGAVVLTVYDLADSIGHNPAADRLLLNMIRTENKRLF